MSKKKKTPQLKKYRFLKEPPSFAEAGFYLCSMPFGLTVFPMFCLLVTGFYLFLIYLFVYFKLM